MAKWILKEYSGNVDNMCSCLNITRPLAQALLARNVNTKTLFKNYFGIEKLKFGDITKMSGVLKAYEIIKKALENKKKICIYGDYDVDGVSSTVILYKSLKNLGANVDYFIPNRMKDGFGMNVDSVKRIMEKGVDLIITCDNGITAVDEIKMARESGVQVVVFDHHEPNTVEGKQNLPIADAVVDAKMENCGYEFTQMCAGGLCYRLMSGLYAYLGKEFTLEEELVVFAGLATNCDVVELIGENRVILQRALELLNTNIVNTGLRMLVDIIKNSRANTNYTFTVNEFTLGFEIGPCINACGRLKSANMAVETFLEDNEERATELAQEMYDINIERKAITNANTEAIIDEIENSPMKYDKVLVVYAEDLHESIAGIVAGRLKEVFNRPAIVLTKGENCAKGSGRSMDCYNLHQALTAEEDLLLKFGGHSKAAGLSMAVENIDELRKRMNENCTLTAEDLEEAIMVDAIIALDEIDYTLAMQLSLMKPFGERNEQPIFESDSLQLKDISFSGQDLCNAVMTIMDEKGGSCRATAFGMGETIKEYLGVEVIAGRRYALNYKVDMLYNIVPNSFNGSNSGQAKIRKIRKSEKN